MVGLKRNYFIPVKEEEDGIATRRIQVQQRQCTRGPIKRYYCHKFNSTGRGISTELRINHSWHDILLISGTVPSELLLVDTLQCLIVGAVNIFPRSLSTL